MATAQIPLHETPDLTIDDIVEANPKSLKLRLSAGIDKAQADYFKELGKLFLRVNLKSRLARLGYNIAVDGTAGPVLDGTEVSCDAALEHHMRQYGQGFNPLDLIVQQHEESKALGKRVRIAKVIGYSSDDVLTSEEIEKEIKNGRIAPLVAYRVYGNVLYLALHDEVFEPNGRYGIDTIRSILMEENGRSQIDSYTKKRHAAEIIAKSGFGPIAGTSVGLGGFEALVLDPNVVGVKHSEARFLSRSHDSYVHLEFYGNNSHSRINEIGIMVIRPKFI